MIKTNYINELTADLIARLPELEWKVTGLNTFLLKKSINNNVFRAFDLTGSLCISEIKEDIISLSKQSNDLAAHHLAAQIKRKISILVGVCRLEKKNKVKKEGFSISMLTTRQQWLQSLEQEVDVLLKQHKALSNTLSHMESSKVEPSILLNLRSELGQLEKKLTLAQEGLNKASSISSTH